MIKQKAIFLLACAVVALAALVGCSGGSGITIKEGEYLVVDSDIKSGQVQVTVISDDAGIDKISSENSSVALTIECEFDGVGRTEYGLIMLEDYMVYVKGASKNRQNFLK